MVTPYQTHHAAYITRLSINVSLTGHLDFHSVSPAGRGQTEGGWMDGRVGRVNEQRLAGV